MDESVFRRFVDLIYNESGITLRKGKEALLMARIHHRMRALHLESYEDYLNYVLTDQDPYEKINLLNVISTNVTSFFREGEHFEMLAKVLPKIAEAGINDIRIWSAACSTGEEPYSISMVAQEVLQSTNVQYKVLATDISTRVIEKAQRAQYSSDDVAKVPVAYRERYLGRYMKKVDKNWEIAEAVKKNVVFARINLSQTPYPMKGPFDIIFCRNVMIYFDAQVRSKLINEMVRLLRPGGLALVGHSETLTDLKNSLIAIKPSVYRKPGGPDGPS